MIEPLHYGIFVFGFLFGLGLGGHFAYSRCITVLQRVMRKYGVFEEDYPE